MLGSVARRALRCNPPCALQQQEISSAMSHRLRPLMLLVIALLALAVTACGGGGGDEKATSSSDVNQLLKDTFSEGKSPKSGKLHVALKLDGNFAGAAASGPVSVTLDGPFESQGTGKLPKFDMDAALAGAGQNFKAGATSTGEKGFVSFQGQEYAVSDQVFKQFKASYEQAVKQSSGTSKQQSLATLGIDPAAWLKNPKNEGEAKVGDTDTIKISGDVDMDRMLDDISKATSQARSLGIQGFENLPSQLTPQQRKQVADSIKNIRTEIFTGKDDSIMRRLHLAFDLKNGSESANVDLDFSYTDVNEGQDIKSPSNAKPFDQLLGQLQGLAGQLGGTASGGSSSSGGSSGASPSAEDFKKYSDCVAKAGNDPAKAQKCADLLK
jgi:hypothetical protein